MNRLFLRCLNFLAALAILCAGRTAVAESPQQLLHRGEQHLAAGELAAAIESFSAAIKQDPNFQDAYAARARAYHRLEAVAANAEERDQAAIGYIADEHRLGKIKATPFIAREWNEYTTNRTFALAVIHLTAWVAVFYMFWYHGQPIGGAAAICLFVFLVTWLVPIVPIRYGLGPFALFCVIVGALLGKKEPKGKEHSDSPLEAAVREQEARQPRANPDDYATNSKHCPSCSREVSEITRVCPRCSYRF
jgi:hypothetical protein